MFYYQTLLTRAVQSLNEITNTTMLSKWDNRVNDLMYSGMELLEDGVTEKFTFKHLIETAAIFRIRPDWFDR